VTLHERAGEAIDAEVRDSPRVAGRGKAGQLAPIDGRPNVPAVREHLHKMEMDGQE
jgi:hypothetical protein